MGYVFQKQGARRNHRPKRVLMRSAKDRERGSCDSCLDHNDCLGTDATASILIHIKLIRFFISFVLIGFIRIFKIIFISFFFCIAEQGNTELKVL